MKLPKEFVWHIERTKTGFSAYESTHPLYTTATTIAQMLNQCYEAESLYFNQDEKRMAKIKHRLVWDWKSFFIHYKIINAKILAERIGMNASLLSQYIQGTKMPSPQQINKIIDGIHLIGQELKEMQLE
jgi:transcriptional regulator with XRE-family HTH domain